MHTSPAWLGFNTSGSLIEIHSRTLKPPPPPHPCKSCQINALHPSSVHMALKGRSATQITALLHYNFVGSGSALYPRRPEIPLTDRAVSPDVSVTWRGKRNRQLISRGLSRRSVSKLGFGPKFITNKSVSGRPLACSDAVEWFKRMFIGRRPSLADSRLTMALIHVECYAVM